MLKKCFYSTHCFCWAETKLTSSILVFLGCMQIRDTALQKVILLLLSNTSKPGFKKQIFSSLKSSGMLIRVCTMKLQTCIRNFLNLYVFIFADRAKALFFIRFSSPFVCSLCWTILCSQNDFSFCLSWIRAAFITWQQQLHSSRRNTSPQKLRCGFNKIKKKSVYLLLALFTSFLFCFLSLSLCPLSLSSVSSSPLFPL